MQPKLLTNETIVQQVEVGLRLFVFTNKRLIVQNTNDSESRYTTYDMISRPSLTSQVLTDEIMPKIQPLVTLISLVYIVGACIWAFLQKGPGAFGGSLLYVLFITPAVAIGVVILAFIIAWALKKKPRHVMLFQILMKDGTLFVNEYFETELTSKLNHVEHLLIESSLGQLGVAATVDGGYEDPAQESKISQQGTPLVLAHHDQPTHHALPELSPLKAPEKSTNKGYKFAIATLVLLLAGAVAYSLSIMGKESRDGAYTAAERSENESVENAPDTIRTQRPKSLGAEASAPVAADNAEEASDDNEIVRSKYVPNLFGEFGETAIFKGKVGKMAATYTLVLREDQQVEGSYSYAGREQLYTLKGRMDEGDGSIMLTEFTDGKATATCELVAEGTCYVGQMKNTDGRSFPMNMCAQE